jgi:peptide chain release factor 1
MPTCARWRRRSCRSPRAFEEQEQALQVMLLPRDPKDDNNCYLEIRAGAGGDEAAIFGGSVPHVFPLRRAPGLACLHRQLQRRRARRLQGGDRQGGRRARLRPLKFESGGHRVQRVPETESQGRVHTSACTVAVLPEVPEAEQIRSTPPS